MKKQSEKFNELIAKKLKFYREYRGLSRKEFSVKSNIPLRNIERYENNENRIPCEYVATFCKTLEIDPAVIFDAIVNGNNLLSAEEVELIKTLKGLNLTPILDFLNKRS